MSTTLPWALRPLLYGLALTACEAARPVAPPAAPAPTSPARPTAAAPPAARAETPRRVARRLPAPPRLVALGDLHGDLAATQAALRLAGATDERDAWIGKDLVVVQTGDQLDRGDGEREIMDLLERLRREAAAAGGALHVLSGNHELMNTAGDLRYVTERGFLEFAAPPGVDLQDPRARAVPEPMRGRWLAFAPGGPYAKKLAEQPVILVVGDTVFTHGGLSPEHVARGIDAINDEVRRWYLGQGEISPELLQDDGSPVWTRRYCQNPRPSDCAALREALAAVPAKRLVVGHTVHTEGIQSACDETVWCIDVGMAAYYGGPVQALEIRGDSVAILRAGATSPAP